MSEYDKQYEAQIQISVVQAIFDASKDKSGKVMALHAEEIVNALVDVMAMLIESSPQAQRAKGLRELCADISDRLRRRTKAAQSIGGLASVFRGTKTQFLVRTDGEIN